jgi:hypothetical protein
MPEGNVQPKSESVGFLWSCEGPQAAAAVRNVVVIGYAEGSELLAARDAYPRAMVTGIEIDERAVSHVKTTQQFREGGRIRVAPAMDFQRAVGDEYLRPGNADRIVMANVAPYMDEQMLQNTLNSAKHMQTSGDLIEIGTYGVCHHATEYVEKKKMHVVSAEKFLGMAQEEGYALKKARVRVHRKNPDSVLEGDFDSAEELIDFERDNVAGQPADAWHTMELILEKDDELLVRSY